MFWKFTKMKLMLDGWGELACHQRAIPDSHGHVISAHMLIHTYIIINIHTNAYYFAMQITCLTSAQQLVTVDRIIKLGYLPVHANTYPGGEAAVAGNRLPPEKVWLPLLVTRAPVCKEEQEAQDSVFKYS